MRDADHSAGAYSAYANARRIDAEIAKDQPVTGNKRITGASSACIIGTYIIGTYIIGTYIIGTGSAR